MAKAIGDQLARTLRTAEGRADGRRKLIVAIRAAARRRGMEDEDRRAVQLQLVGKPSLADMTAGELGKVLDHLNRDWTRTPGSRPHLSKARALWWTLHWLGAVADPSDTALGAFAKRQCGVDRLAWMDHRQAPAVIEALKAWAAREGVAWPAEADWTARRARHPHVDQAIADRHAVLVALGGRLLRHGVLRRSDPYGLAGAVLKSDALEPWSWTARQLDVAIAELGKRLWRAMAADGALPT